MKLLNTDDIFLRNLSISFLELLNEDITIDQSRDDNRDTYTIPFYYNYGTDEGFLKDFYIGLPDTCRIPRIAEGTYDIVPRGIIDIANARVNPNGITNRFIRGSYRELEKNDQNENVQVGYSAQLYAIPLIVTFNVKVIVDNINKMLRVFQEIIDMEYSNRVMYFQFKGMRIGAGFHFPESQENDKKYVFDLMANNKLHDRMNVEIETYYPSFERTSKRLSTNVMDKILLRVKDREGNVADKEWIQEVQPQS